VFRRQNRVMTRLMMAAPKEIDSLSTREQLRLERLEKRMNDACAPLNDVASARSQGRDTSFEQQNDVRQTVRVCAAETARLEQFLDEMKISG
ncbi:MAG: hypothetical protein RQ847_10120, partial [Wenzhouxiangellaceae bacterium]|nr:hypothetical protein [Wenzhouxiangellaceae bacterium]